MKQGLVTSGQLTKITAIGFGVVLCLAIDIALNSMEIKTPYIALLPGIAGACAIGGFSAALWAIFFSTLGLWYFFIPPGGFALPDFGDFAHLCVFVGVSAFVCWVIDGLRRSNDALSKDNVVLGCKISNLLNRHKAHL